MIPQECQQLLIQVLCTTIESPFAFFQMEIESVRSDAIELLKPTFGEAPEALNAVDVATAASELIRPVMDSEVLGVTDIDQPIVAAPAITVDDRLGCNATTNNGLQGGFLAVRHDLGIDLAVTLQQSEDDGLARRPAPTLATNTSSAEVRFIDFNFSGREWRTTLAIFGHALTDFEKDRVDRFVRQTSQLGNIGRR